MIWIDTQQAFDTALARIGAQPLIAVDTEADSLHSYFDKVCLIQISIPEEDFVIDPLADIELDSFGAVLADANVRKVLHGGDYDLRILNRDFGFTMANLVDTMVSAQLLGYQAFGLAALLERHFGVKVNKTHQRADWSMRPLPSDMLQYAAMDTHYLIDLYAKIRGELEAVARWPWAKEEFARLEAIRFRENEDDGEPFRRLKGLGTFDRRSLAIVRDLYDWRDKLARKADRPPFKIIGNDVLLEIAKEKQPDLKLIKSISRYHVDRYGREITRIVRQALELAEDALPERGESKPFFRDRQLEARVERLKKVRDRIARDLKLDPSVVAPRHVLTAIATIEPRELTELDRIPAMRDWQKAVVGPALLDVMRHEKVATEKLF